MDREEFERIKAAEKAHLRKLKELKDALRTLERRQKIARAVEEIESPDVLRDHEEALERLALETLKSEARLDIALESAREESSSSAPARPAEPDEDELRRVRAQALLRRMKEELTGGTEEAPRASTPEADSETKQTPTRPFPQGDLPEKTIGRMQSPRQSPAEEQ